MISKCQIQKYICQIENDIDDDVYSNYNRREQYFGLVYGIKIARGIKKYPIECDGIEITDEYRRGLLKGLHRVLWCIIKTEEHSVDECISNYVDVFKQKLDHNSMLINVKLELDKSAYTKFIADMKQIEKEFKTGNVDYSINATRISYVGGMEDFIYKLGYTIRSTDNKQIFKFDHVDYKKEEVYVPIQTIGDKDGHLIKVKYNELPKKEDTIEHIPATLKDVCEWWIKTYPKEVFGISPVKIIEIRNNMKSILKSMK